MQNVSNELRTLATELKRKAPEMRKQAEAEASKILLAAIGLHHLNRKLTK